MDQGIYKVQPVLRRAFEYVREVLGTLSGKIVTGVAVAAIAFVGQQVYGLTQKPSPAEVNQQIESRLNQYTIQHDEDLQKKMDRTAANALAPVEVQLQAISDKLDDLKQDVRSLSHK